MSFSFEQALDICTASLNSRRSVQRNSYIMYCGNDAKRYDVKVTMPTVKSLINEFRTNRANYKYAFITRLDDDKVLRFYNRDVSKKFFSMTRKGKKTV